MFTPDFPATREGWKLFKGKIPNHQRAAAGEHFAAHLGDDMSEAALAVSWGISRGLIQQCMACADAAPAVLAELANPNSVLTWRQIREVVLGGVGDDDAQVATLGWLRAEVQAKRPPTFPAINQYARRLNRTPISRGGRRRV
ncbi:MAG: hypothetical protein WCG26_01390 [Chloroflexales bacterium]